MKTTLRVLELQEDHPARKLATYFLGVQSRLFFPSLPSGPKALSPTPFYRHVVGIYKRISSLQLDTSPLEIRNTELAQELLVNSGCEAPNSSFPGVLLTPSWLPGTVQDMLWRFGWAVLPTADRMYKWHYVPTEQCVKCREHESNEHALLMCRSAVTFWSLVSRAFHSLRVERFIKGGRCPNSAFARLVLAAGLARGSQLPDLSQCIWKCKPMSKDELSRPLDGPSPLSFGDSGGVMAGFVGFLPPPIRLLFHLLATGPLSV
ncbi:hypothetical protein HPB50_017089 [Hyalomma asiaticum]|uniref:Uncharacterized protein n=1 Tax=Hyalomma asiaticum TaxID=266040 RepID=A0ACB7TP28_HYAAI|nr:hypothetical protein HPB50_017089 [Hyalomma asiaticum]